MKICTVTTDKGLVLNVKRVDPGEYYGRNQCVKCKPEETLIEFWDARFSHISPLGQFVSRYCLSTLIEHAPYEGINLDGGVADWEIDAAALRLALWEVAGLIPNFSDGRFDAGPLTIRIGT